MALMIRSSAIHAAGCYTTTSVRKGTRVAEYTGPRMSKDEADAANEDSPITYLFGLGDGSVVIDGHCMAMFINHSCDPNCETEEIAGRVLITAIRKIDPGEEITYDYCLYDGGGRRSILQLRRRRMPWNQRNFPKEVRRRKSPSKPSKKKPTRKRQPRNLRHRNPHSPPSRDRRRRRRSSNPGKSAASRASDWYKSACWLPIVRALIGG